MNNRKQLIEVAQLYYYHQMTQNDIAKQCGISRIKVSRMLQRARDLGIVSITINDSPSYEQLEKTLEESFDLQKVLICDNVSSDVRVDLAQKAGGYLNSILQPGDIVAVGWGRTLEELSKYCYGNLGKDTMFTPLIGGHGVTNFNVHASTIANRLAENYMATASSLMAPAFALTQSAANMYQNDPTIKHTLGLAKKANITIFSVGTPTDGDTTIQSTGYLSPNEINLFQSSKAACDIVSIIFIDPMGYEILPELAQRRISVSRETFEGIDKKICIAGGKKKHLSIFAALNGGYFDELVTDLETAQYLIAQI